MPPCCCRPLTPPSPCHPGILLSIYSSFNVSIFAWNGSCLWLCVSKSRVPLKASCCCNFLRCLVTFCIRWDILSGPVGGWVGGQLLSCGLFLWFFLCFLLLFFYFWLQRKNSSCWFAHRSCQRNQDWKRKERERRDEIMLVTKIVNSLNKLYVHKMWPTVFVQNKLGLPLCSCMLPPTSEAAVYLRVWLFTVGHQRLVQSFQPPTKC